MLSLILSMVLRWPQAPAPCDDGENWLRDPLSHPSIARMSAAQLADLPAAELRARLRC
ncbi:MAG: hypothetical protein MEQ84_05030 [Mesorhizobium sp.]|nr:hypothetical protein [Mesorhizobium sp.]